MSLSNRKLGLETLEAREVPAIVFVGGWGSSSYQYASDGAATAVKPGESFTRNFEEIKLDSAAQAGTAVALAADPGASAAPGQCPTTPPSPPPPPPPSHPDDVVVDGRIITAENYEIAVSTATRVGNDLINDFVEQDKYVM
jgi:hypothetical protein